MTNPTLTLEEELDVLEAVYKVGKEKGLDLLRPEQMKKLMEAGRVRKNEGGISKRNDPIRKIVIETINSLLARFPEITENDEWNNFSKAQKSNIVSTLFSIVFGISVEDYFINVNELDTYRLQLE